MSIRGVICIFAIVFAARGALAQHYFELRGADTKYRFADWNYTFRNAAVVDVFYVGVPGNNEFNVGGGYAVKLRPWLTIIPLVYATAAKEDRERGVKTAALIILDRDGWKVNSFFSHFSPLSGAVTHYQLLDTADLTRVVARNWEMGLSTGFFHSAGKWNPQSGPLVKRTDRLGAWAASFRFGPQREFRVVRVFQKATP